MRRSLPLLAAVLVLASCAPNSTTTDTRPGGPPATVGADATTTTRDPRPCAATTVIAPVASADGIPAVERLPAGNPHAAAVAASQAMFDCAYEVVVVDSAGIDRIALAAVLAVAFQAPLLFGDAGATSLLAYELDRLAPSRVWLVGNTAVADAPRWAEVTRIGGDDRAIAAEITDLIDADEDLPLPSTGGTAAVSVAIEAMVTGKTLTPPAPDVAVPPLTTGDDIVAGTGASGMLWLVDTGELEAALVAAAGAITSGGYMALVDGADLRREQALARDLAPIAAAVRTIQVVGGTEDAGWQARVLLRGDELPGGGFLMFPGRRLVALYGSPLTTSLGPLGEQDPAAGLSRIEGISAGYDTDGNAVLPTFEIIATVAAGDAGPDGDYSNEMPLDLLHRWVDFAGANGMYVLLDLQPGRTTFLSQAVLYEELLLEPHVGLALDPEWRLGPDEVHLEQIGAVGADEVNEVIEWLAALTRDNALPQKMLLIHQFRADMLPDRERIMATPELSLVIQMDGHGTIPEKMTSWVRTTTGWETDQFEYGWKNFYDEDVPGPMSAAEVLALVPTTVYISFQ
ncbi:MAG TPA: hypothetical protein DCY40_02885 [Actinobacteria bacterium]|nr:hypothetical protein [Actinomycetota bacterium]